MAQIQDSLTLEQFLTTNRLTYGRNTPLITITATTTSGTLTLTSTSYTQHILTGTAIGYSVVLPDATTLVNGWTYIFFNNSTQSIVVKNNGGVQLFIVSAYSVGYFTLQDNATTNGVWAYWQIFSGSTAGLIYYKVTDNTPFTTTSLTYIIINNMTVTPSVSGTYAVWFNGISTMTSGNKTHHHAIFNNGAVVADSERYQTSSASGAGMIDSTITTISVVAGQTVDVRAYTDTGTSLSYGGKTLILARITD